MLKSGNTKMKPALSEFLIRAGIKLTSIASYNHLGNNGGKHLSEQVLWRSHIFRQLRQRQFKSKEISKYNVVDDRLHVTYLIRFLEGYLRHTVTWTVQNSRAHQLEPSGELLSP
jgi:myo-inositol-1-phosphate synthase